MTGADRRRRSLLLGGLGAAGVLGLGVAVSPRAGRQGGAQGPFALDAASGALLREAELAGTGTVMQSFSFDNTNRWIIAAQIRDRARGDLRLSRLSLDGGLDAEMMLRGFGHGGQIGVVPDGTGSHVWVESSPPTRTARPGAPGWRGSGSPTAGRWTRTPARSRSSTSSRGRAGSPARSTRGSAGWRSASRSAASSGSGCTTWKPSPPAGTGPSTTCPRRDRTSPGRTRSRTPRASPSTTGTSTPSKAARTASPTRWRPPATPG
ncbi:hypothetical protein [Kitasatospora paranensis]|uniref:hypothetical protein n=1 Tax=Kitasatospora paranensis TaxID=258053 RepID=UPI0031E57F91